ncbi:hypothetical protein G6F40_013163 [Rhizopus arrhizus]|nr:hypothetical protein G6F40_013163 [Rhizopus arrhizus]
MTLLRAALRLSLLLPWTASAAEAEDVRVYRCVASNGAVALQDRPCNSGRQEVRDLQRPRDPAPRVVRSDATPPLPSETPAIREREVRHVYIQPPQPMYECAIRAGSRCGPVSGFRVGITARSIPDHDRPSARRLVRPLAKARGIARLRWG